MTYQEWLNNDELSIAIFEKKYRQDNESFEEWLDRVSGDNKDIRRLIKEKKFLFGGRILANRGRVGKGACLNNCFVLESPTDSIEGIFNTAKKMARTYSYGGGVGLNISTLRPRGFTVNNAAKTTTGAVSFTDLYDTVTGLIGQNNRRGALLLTLNSNHPDIEEFVDLKADLDKVTHANISVFADDDFINAATNKHDDCYLLRYGDYKQVIHAKDLLHKIAQRNWEMAEPGMLFYNNINENHLLSAYPDVDIHATNPCGEVPMMANDACLLGSINLAAYVIEDASGPYFDFETFAEDVAICILALNEVQEESVQYLPLPEQRKQAEDWRRIGLGIMGLADMFIKMRITYGSKASLNLADNIMGLMASMAIQTSMELGAKTYSFPKFDPYHIVDSSFYSEHTELVPTALRNSGLISIAPTGTISTMLKVSGGIEPLFDYTYTRKTESLNGKDTYYKVETPIIQEVMEKLNITSLKDLPEYCITAKEIPWQDRIAMQSVIQRHVDQAISSTINLPKTATVEDIEQIYIEAWRRELKGVTVYREGCSRAGILTSSNEETSIQPVETPVNAVGKKRKVITGCGSLHVLAYFHPKTGKLLEVYLNKGSTGGCHNFMTGLSRMISLTLRLGGTLEQVIDQLKSTGACPSYAVASATKHNTSPGACCPMAVGNALMDMSREMKSEINGEVIIEDEDNVLKCPVCGNALAPTNGCFACSSCGWSKCN